MYVALTEPFVDLREMEAYFPTLEPFLFDYPNIKVYQLR